MKAKISCLFFVCFLVFIGLASFSHAFESNPPDPENGIIETGGYFETEGLTAYTDRALWLSDVAVETTLIDFDEFDHYTLITIELASYGISMVSGTVPSGDPADQYVWSSEYLTFPIFNRGDLPSEPNFLCNHLEQTGAKGTITFEFSSPITAIGAYVADGAANDEFRIEVFNGPDSLGYIQVPPRQLPDDSFVGLISTGAFDRATFSALYDDPYESWGLDNVELASAGAWAQAYKTLFEPTSAGLKMMRAYRDRVLSRTDPGRRYKNLLYSHSEEALAVFRENPELLTRAAELIEVNKDAVRDVLEGSEGVVYNTHEIADFLDAYARKAPPTLSLLAKIVRFQMLVKQRRGEPFFGFRLE